MALGLQILYHLRLSIRKRLRTIFPDSKFFRRLSEQDVRTIFGGVLDAWVQEITKRLVEILYERDDLDFRRRSHAAIVIHCKEICRVKPKCEVCPLRNVCEYCRVHRLGGH